MPEIVLTDQRQEEVERQVLPQELPPVDVRVAAIEQALKFTMENIKVQITLPTPLIGVPAQVITTNLYQVYLEQLQQIRAANERAGNGQ
jgi:hypothetical protein